MQQFQNSIISLKMLYHCFASFKQSPLDFFKLVDSRLILVPLYDSLNRIISGVHQSHLGCWDHMSEKVKLRGLDYVAYKMCQCALFLKDKLSGPLRPDPWHGRILVEYGSRIYRHRPIADPIRGCALSAFEPSPISWRMARRALGERGRLCHYDRVSHK